MRIFCAHCRYHLYNYGGEFKGRIIPKDFKPADSTVPPPAPGAPLVCKNCGQRWHMLKANGSILLVTDRGIMPRPPDGPRHIFTFPEEVKRVVEPYNQVEGTDYEEPTHVKSEPKKNR
jgi:hypothetical protein